MNQTFWDKFWKDKHGDVVVYQRPNAWIIGWLVLAIIAAFTYGGFSHAISKIATVVLIIWSLLELFQGVNYFRRTLGLLVLLVSVGHLFGIGL
ncbi:MAG TPA: hypothetical protein VF401_01575 [Candidatus Saccharimonadales bacterium]